MNNELESIKSPVPFPAASIVAPVSENVASRVFPSGTFLMTDSSCWTPDGKLGTCSNLRSCYPDTKLSPTTTMDLWLLSARATCIHSDSDKRQVIKIHIQ